MNTVGLHVMNMVGLHVMNTVGLRVMNMGEPHDMDPVRLQDAETEGAMNGLARAIKTRVTQVVSQNA